jgi:aminopeptidase
MEGMSTTAIAETPTTTKDFETKLDRLAEVAIKSGLDLAPGQQLVMTASVEALALVRRITEHAYRAGASLVTDLIHGR